VFGEESVWLSIQRVQSELLRWGYGTHRATFHVARVLYTAMLMNLSPYLEDLSKEVLNALHQGDIPAYLKRQVVLKSRALTALGIIDKPLSPTSSTDDSVGTTTLRVIVSPCGESGHNAGAIHRP
jgi:hypothetical protein